MITKTYFYRYLFLIQCSLLLICSSSYAYHNTAEYNPLKSIVEDPDLRIQFAPFLDNVLRQISSEKFFNRIDQLKLSHNFARDHEWYNAIVHDKKMHSNQFIALYRQLKALNFQKKVLAKQAQNLLQDMPEINGCVEIGTPGTYLNMLKKILPIKGHIYTLNDAEKFIKNPLQKFAFKVSKKFFFHDTFVPLNDYASIGRQLIPDNSVDLVVCFIGLHHIPVEKVDTFIASITRILRPGGILLLRDHDCTNSKLLSFTYAAHSIFNTLIPQLSLDEEMAEYRNFRDISYWADLLKKYNLHVGDKRLVQHGDPTWLNL